MTTSVAIVENGHVAFEPTEVTYRTIFYYLDATMAKMRNMGTHSVPRQEADDQGNQDRKRTKLAHRGTTWTITKRICRTFSVRALGDADKMPGSEGNGG